MMNLKQLEHIEFYEDQARGMVNKHWRRIMQAECPDAVLNDLPNSNSVTWWSGQKGDPEKSYAVHQVTASSQVQAQEHNLYNKSAAYEHAISLVEQLLPELKNASVISNRCNANVFEKDGAIVLQLSVSYVSKESA